MRKTLGSVVLAALFVSAAQAGLSGNTFEITATNADGTATHTVDLSELVPDGNGNFSWTLGSEVELVDGDGDTIGVLTGGTVLISEDPVVNIGWSFNAGDGGDTSVSITTATLSFPLITLGTGEASAGFTLTNQSRNGLAATLTGTGGLLGTHAFSANSNVGTFVDLETGFTAPTDGDTDNSDNNYGPVPVALVSDITVSYSFDLTAGDSASSTGRFEVVPEPTSLALALLGALSLLRRRGS